MGKLIEFDDQMTAREGSRIEGIIKNELTFFFFFALETKGICIKKNENTNE